MVTRTFPLAAAWLPACAVLLAQGVAAQGYPAGPEGLAALGRIGIGDLAARGEGGCTAVLVAPDQVLTATHCVTDRTTGRPAAPDRIVFAPAAAPGQPARLFVAASLTMPDRPGPIGGDRGLDVARVRLQEPVPPDLARPIALSPPATDAPVTLAGFPVRDGTGLAVQSGCPFILAEPQVLIAACAVQQGYSGGAMLQTPDGTPRLVAIIVARSGTAQAPQAWAVVPPSFDTP